MNLFFPKYDYEFACDNNSLIMMPSWVEHGVSEVSIKDSDSDEVSSSVSDEVLDEVSDKLSSRFKTLVHR